MTFFRPGQNCWQIAEADRVAFLVDGEAYFRAVADACESARRVIFFIGWDFDSRICLRRDDPDDFENFDQFVKRLVREKPDLHVYLLEWDFPMLYSLEREAFPLLNFGWMTDGRVHFELDDVHPVGASHHQKIVVVDDLVAFVGGFDLSRHRWDTPAHRPDHPGRCDNGTRYGPFHDVQMLVAGEAAAKLGDLVRQRWLRATGDRPPNPGGADHDPWPSRVSPVVKQVPVAILRTEPEHEGDPEVREIEAFYLDAIAGAKHSIYIENQYLTSQVIGTALEKSLRKNDGPEILIVLPQKCSGWLEEETMGALRHHLVKGLQRADEHQRLRVCYAGHDGLGSGHINLHSKILIVDDRVLTVGSANLSNRSMGFDTECNLALAADGRADVAGAIADFRLSLLAEHLDAEPAQIARSLKETGSLLATVAAMPPKPRSLKELAFEKDQAPVEETLSASTLADPERPISLDALLDEFGFGLEPQDQESKIKDKAWRFLMVILLAIMLAIFWRWSPLQQWLNIDTLLAAADYIRDSPAAVPIVLFLYVVGSCLMFPVTLMILATALSFGSFTGFTLALAGSLLGGLTSYLLGRWLGREVVRRLAGEKLNLLSRKLARRGWLAVALVRVIPIAPFTVVNLVAGSTHISTRSFLLGTAVGMGPGILAIIIFEEGLERAVREPSWGSLALAIVALTCAVLVLIFGNRWLMRKDKKDEKHA